MEKSKVFIVNSASAPNSARVNVKVSVNASSIRRETHNGRDHIVVPSFTLPDGVVMNGGLYPHDEIEKSYKSLEGTFAPLGHPQVDGEYVGAETPEAVNAYHFGAFNRNVERRGNRIYLEKYIDVEKAKESEMGRRVLNAIEKGEPIHTSTGIFLDREISPNTEGHSWIARNMTFNHDCLLLDEIGAATPDDGVGMMVNKTLVINSTVANEDEALDNSYAQKLEILAAAIKERFSLGDTYAWVQDFDDQGVVYSTPRGMYRISYHLEDGNPILTGEPKEVTSKTEYIVKNRESFLSRIQSMLKCTSKITEQPVQVNISEEVPDMKPEELQAALDAQAEKLQGAFNESLAALKASNDEALAAVNAKLTANSDAELVQKRAVVAKEHGEVVANALTGDALDAMFAKCQTAASLLGGMPQVNSSDFKAPTMGEHFGSAK